MDSRAFNLSKLLYDILDAKIQINEWKDFESLVANACRAQDPNCVRNVDAEPDILLSNGYGIEAKSISSSTRDINLNSAAPDPNTFYVVGYIKSRKVKNIAIVSGANFYCKEIDDLKKVNTSLQNLSNKKIRFRTRIMWQIESPFITWTLGNFIVDKQGKVTYS